MSGIADFAQVIIIASVTSGALCVLLPQGSKLSSYMKFVSAIVVFAIISLPICKAIKSCDDIFEKTFIIQENENMIITEDYLKAQKFMDDEASRIIEQKVRALIREDFPDYFCDVAVSCPQDASPVIVLKPSTGDVPKEKIKTYLEKKLLIKVRIEEK